MITKIELENFKKFKKSTIALVDNGISLLAGANNSGKSSILHALAVWEFSKMYLEFEKGPRAFINSIRTDGIGLSLDDFSPINIPNLKYLWTNLNSGSSYSLKIKCYWKDNTGVEKYLEIGLALANERLFIKCTDSNTILGDKIPTIAYLPPFAGITDKESWYSEADRRRFIGRGMAGAVLRNSIIEMYRENIRGKELLKKPHKKLTIKLRKELVNFMETDAFEVLNSTLFSVFQSFLIPQVFNPAFHNYVKVDVSKGQFNNRRSQYTPFKDYNKRDIMVEGSGFLQWLSVYTYILNKNIDVLLLDEPDAHLHCDLQIDLFNRLIDLSQKNSKQVLIASHSTEIIKNIQHNLILAVKKDSIKYLNDEHQKISLISNLGAEFSPKINKLQKTKKLIIVENTSDLSLLKIWAIKMGLEWPTDLVEWPFANKQDSRKHFILQLKGEIPNLQCISLVDRDSNDYGKTNSNLRDGTYNDDLLENGKLLIRYRMWRRRYIENYLICPAAIARKVKINIDIINEFIRNKHSIIIPEEYNRSEQSQQTQALFDIYGKDFISNIENEYSITKYDIAKEMEVSEIFDDIKTLINEIINM